MSSQIWQMKDYVCPPLGKSDHNLVFHTSTYISIIQQQLAIKTNSWRWSKEAEQTPTWCFEATDLNAQRATWGRHQHLCGVTDYITFWEKSIIPTKTVRCFPNNTSWITSDLKKLMNIKKKLFREGHRESLRSSSETVEKEDKRKQGVVQKNLESKPQEGNMRDVGSGRKRSHASHCPWNHNFPVTLLECHPAPQGSDGGSHYTSCRHFDP